MPQAAYTTLCEVFLTRVIRIESVQCERAAAVEESRQPGSPASTEDVELFFDHGIFPGVSARPRNPLWLISTAEPSKPPPKLTALERGLLAALRAWHQLVRELRNGTLIATGERFDRRQEPWRDADRRQIGSETWLNINGDLWFDVGAKTVCRMMDVGFGSRPVPVWFKIRVRGADEAAEFEDIKPDATASVSDAPPSKRRREPSEEATLRTTLFYAAVGDRIGLSTARLLRLVGTAEKPTQAWKEACRTKGVTPADYPPPKRDAIDRMLDRRK